MGSTATVASNPAGAVSSTRLLPTRVYSAYKPRTTLAPHRLRSAVETEAWRWLRARAEREYSFVDASSFAVMRRRRIREALAFDGDFNAAGFVEVRPQ